MIDLPMVHSYDGFSRLEEVWLGDVYPESFYDFLDIDVRNTFCKITEWTKQDLDEIEAFLRSEGVVVRRPSYDLDVQHYIRDGVLLKPEICPRDNYLVNGNRLLYHRSHAAAWGPAWPWRHVIDDYQQDAGSQILAVELPFWISGANSVRAGRDFYLDCVPQKTAGVPESRYRELFESTIAPLFPEQRCHYFSNGGHIDSCFKLVRPGLVMTTRYWNEYTNFWPGWEVINILEPEFADHRLRGSPGASNGRWYVPDLHLPAGFNQHVIDFASDWVGDYRETFFEVNCLMLDSNNIMVLGRNTAARHQLEQRGLRVHEMPFRCRTFWDGGLHCLTLDVRRQGTCVDYAVDSSKTFAD